MMMSSIGGVVESEERFVFVKRLSVTRGSEIGQIVQTQVYEEAYFVWNRKESIFFQNDKGSKVYLRTAWARDPIAVLREIELKCGDRETIRFQNDTGSIVLFPDRRDPVEGWYRLFSKDSSRDLLSPNRHGCSSCVLVAALPVSYQDRGREMLKDRLTYEDLKRCRLVARKPSKFVDSKGHSIEFPTHAYTPHLPFVYDMSVVKILPNDVIDKDKTQSDNNNVMMEESSGLSLTKCKDEVQAFTKCVRQNDDIGKCDTEQRAYMRCHKRVVNENSYEEEDSSSVLSSKIKKRKYDLPEHLPLDISADESSGDIKVPAGSGSSFRYRFKSLACASGGQQMKGCPQKAVIPPFLGVPALPSWAPFFPGIFGPDFSQLAGLIITAIINGVLGKEIRSQIQGFYAIFMKVLPPVLNLSLIMGLPDPMLILSILEQIKAELLAKLNMVRSDLSLSLYFFSTHTHKHTTTQLKAMAAMALATLQAQIDQLRAALELARLMAQQALAAAQLARAQLQAQIDAANALVAQMVAQMNASIQAAIAQIQAQLNAAKAQLEALLAQAMAAALAALEMAKSLLAQAQAGLAAALSASRNSPFDTELQHKAEQKAQELEAAKKKEAEASQEVASKIEERDSLVASIAKSEKALKTQQENLKNVETLAKEEIDRQIEAKRKETEELEKKSKEATEAVSRLESKLAQLQSEQEVKRQEKREQEESVVEDHVNRYFQDSNLTKNETSSSSTTTRIDEDTFERNRDFVISGISFVSASKGSSWKGHKKPTSRPGGNVLNWKATKCAHETSQWIALSWPSQPQMRISRMRLVVDDDSTVCEGEDDDDNTTGLVYEVSAKRSTLFANNTISNWDIVTTMHGESVYRGETIDLNFSEPLVCISDLRITTLESTSMPSWKSIEVWGHNSERDCRRTYESQDGDVALLEESGQDEIETEAQARLRATLWQEAQLRGEPAGEGSLPQTIYLSVTHALTQHLTREITIQFTKDLTPRIADSVVTSIRSPLKTYLAGHLSRSVRDSTATSLGMIVRSVDFENVSILFHVSILSLE